MPAATLRQLWISRNLLVNLVRRDLTVRYKSTALGFFWTFGKPLAYMLIYHVVFSMIIPVEVRETRIPYALHILAGLLPWMFFTGAAGEAMNSILASANLVRKVRLPLVIFPLAAVLSHAIHFFLAMIVLVAGMVAFGLAPGPEILLLPVVVAVQFTLVLAVSLLLASLNVFYRDIASLWELATVGWFYATPVVYPVYMATEFLSKKGLVWAEWLYLANPMATVTVAYRRVLLYAALENPVKEMPGDGRLALALAITGALSLALLFVAHAVFTRLSRRFADTL